MTTAVRQAITRSISAILLVCLLHIAVNAQVERRRKNLPIAAESKAVERKAAGNTTDMIAYVEDVRVALAGTAFTITFFSKPGLVPTIQIGTSSPRQQDGRWTFPDGQSAGEGNAFASQKTGPLSRKLGTVANTFYTFESRMFNIPELEPGTTYHYIVSIPAEGSSGQHQTTGSFKTADRKVTVVFEAVKIISDGDPDPPRPLPPDCGEISLWFWANHQQPGAQFISIPKLGRGDIGGCSDHLYDIKREISLWNAPNRLTLAVSGRDDDRGDYTGADVLGAFEPAPVERPRDTGAEEINGASGEFNVAKIGAGEIKRFTLVSITAQGGGRGDLMFEVYGYIKVSYPQQP